MEETRTTTTRVGRISLRLKIVSAVCGIVLAGVGAYAASNWIVNLERWLLRRGPVGRRLEPHDQRRGVPGRVEPALPGRGGRRRRDDREPEPVPGDDHRDATAHQHDLRHGVHHERPVDDADGLYCLDAERRDVGVRHGHERHLPYA